jgi:hypothetical protein
MTLSRLVLKLLWDSEWLVSSGYALGREKKATEAKSSK